MIITKLRTATFVLATAFFGAFVASSIRADEGMWLFSNPPLKQIQEKYGVELAPELLDNLQKSCIRFGSGGSASFVSSNGLIMTNHHVGLSTVTSLSTPENNLVLNGFKAEKYEDEIKCPDVKLIVLEEIVDVSAQVEESTRAAQNAKEADDMRAACVKEIEKKASEEKGLKCYVVPLYQGALYHLYCYKELPDVRLVFTPEESVGFFGGDPDNFEYPRYNLDVTFFRAYENNEPYHPKHFLKWSEDGADEADLVLVSGHPARTNRFNTIADLEYQRDVYYPHMMEKYRRREVAFQTFGSLNEENARRVASELFRIQNSRKNRGGILQGLQSPELMNVKIAAENELRKLAKENGSIDFSQGDPWEAIQQAMRGWSDRFVAYDMLESNEAFNCAQVRRARALARYVFEAAKPENERNISYRGASLDERRNELFGAIVAPYANVETLRLGDSLSMLYEISRPVEGGRALGHNCVVKTEDWNAIFGSVSPKARAAEIIDNTKIADKAFCEELVNGGVDALLKSDDPAIKLAVAVEPYAAELRDYYATQVVEPLRAAYAKIASARFQTYGSDLYPDATFTLRLSYGKVAGYVEDDGTQIPFETTIGGAYDHAQEHKFADPYDLSQSWIDAKNEGRAPLDAPINFVTTNDIIGGNSGSPAVNAQGEVVGLVFDGNVQSLVSNFTFEDVQSRAVLVHSTGIREAVRHIYQMPKLADELGK